MVNFTARHARKLADSNPRKTEEAEYFEGCKNLLLQRIYQNAQSGYTSMQIQTNTWNTPFRMKMFHELRRLGYIIERCYEWDYNLFTIYW